MPANVRVYIDVNGSPTHLPEPTWTEVTSLLLADSGLTYERGVSGRTGETWAPGRFQITLKNTAGTYSGPALLRHHDATLGCLRRNGFSVALAAHAMSVLDAYVYGFVLTEVNLPIEPGESAEDFVTEIGVPLDNHPHLAALVAEQVVGRDYAYADEFDYGLDLVLDGLAARLAAAGASAGTSDRR